MPKLRMIVPILLTLVAIADCKYRPLEGNKTIHAKHQSVDCFNKNTLVGETLRMIFSGSSAPKGKQDVSFRIYLRTKREPSEWNGDSKYTGFQPCNKTVFIIHGFRSHGDEDWIKKMANAYLDMEEVNVIAVDWSHYSNVINYNKAVDSIKIVADRIWNFIHRVWNQYRQRRIWVGIHLIGHSLGAHLSGMVAKRKPEHKWNITRITGLDPAQPCMAESVMSLNKTDAPFVDIIHTNGRSVLGVGLGIKAAIGHMDFYPNGGHQQPGCRKGRWYQPFDVPSESVSVCSHGRSHDYFTESLENAAKKWPKTFWGHEWDSFPSSEKASAFVGKACDRKQCVEMGINAVNYRSREGKFFVATANSPPYVEPRAADYKDIKEQLKLDQSAN